MAKRKGQRRWVPHPGIKAKGEDARACRQEARSASAAVASKRRNPAVAIRKIGVAERAS